MNKKKLLITLLVGVMSLVLVNAAIMAYFGQIKTTVDVEQPIAFMVNGVEQTGNQVSEVVHCEAGETCMSSNVYEIVNDGESDRTLSLITSGNTNGVDVSYYGLTGYNEIFLPIHTILDGTSISVEDLGDSVLWTMVVPLDGSYGTGLGSGGQAAWSISIGKGDEILYQVHSNDGSDHDFDFGTYLYSEWDDTLSGNWNGWNTGTGGNNILVSDIDGIEATGNRIASETDGIYTIQIDKELLDFEEFKWVVHVNYETDSLPSAFSWSDTDTTNFFIATIMEELTSPIIVPANSFIEFYPQFSVDSMATEGDYVIYTTVNPAE